MNDAVGLLREPRERRQTMTDLPIACTLTPDALRARRAGLLSDLLQRAEGREDIPEGLRLRFAPTGETLATIARAVEAERHCCRFLRFGITVEPDGGPVFLELTGPPGTREFHWRIARSVTTNLAIFAVAWDVRVLAAKLSKGGCSLFHPMRSLQ